MTGPAVDGNTGGGATADVTIINKLGLHARAAMKFVQTAEQFDAAITVTRGTESVDGTSILDLLMLAAGQGVTVTLTANGPRAPEAIEALCALVAARFGEEE